MKTNQRKMDIERHQHTSKQRANYAQVTEPNRKMRRAMASAERKGKRVGAAGMGV